MGMKWDKKQMPQKHFGTPTPTQQTDNGDVDCVEIVAENNHRLIISFFLLLQTKKNFQWKRKKQMKQGTI